MTTNEMISVLISKTHGEDDDHILDLIYDNYAEFHGWANPQSKEYYNALRSLVEDRIPEEQEQFMDLVNMLCDTHEHVAFIDGLKTGVKLLCELIA